MFRLSAYGGDGPTPKMAKRPVAVQYLNDEITFPVVNTIAESKQRVQKPLLQSFISRSGRIVEQASDYFVAVIRLAISLTVPIFMPEMKLPSTDGVTTLLTVSMVQWDATNGLTISDPVALKLQIPESQRQTFATQSEASMYAVFNHPDELCASVNEAIDTIIASGQLSDSSTLPFNPEMIYTPESKLFSFNVYPHDPFVLPVYTTTIAEPDGIPAGLELPKFSIWFNHCAYPLMKGFNTFHVSKDSYTPSQQGLDYCLRFTPNEDARINKPLFATGSFFGYKLKQDTPTVLPTLETIRVLTDLPSVGEIIPSTDDVETAGILTDFKLDNSLIGSSTTLYYNASLGDARYIKLTGTSPIQAITYRVEAIDTYGQVHRIRLQGPGDFFSIKMAFVENSLVENF